MHTDLTQYERDVLAIHENLPHSENRLEQRRDAQQKLRSLGYLEFRDGYYWITGEGLKAVRAGAVDSW